MSTTTDDRWPVRVWFGLLILAAIAAAWTMTSWLAPRSLANMIAIVASPLLGAVAVVGWWVFAAGVRGSFRWAVPALVLVPLVTLAVTVHKGNELVVAIYGLIAALVVWIGWLAVSVPLPVAVRRGGLLVLLAGLWVVVGMVKVNGTDADVVPYLRWRWQPSDEDLFLAEKPAASVPASTAKPVEVGPGDWPGFRGAKRDAVVTGAKLDSDWATRPPELVWKKRVGPGWGSFALAGGRLFTQEQRGPDEAVVCYDAATGAEVWEFKTPGRFEETISGAGPRATPTVHGTKVYAQGANGRVHRLDAATGKLDWTADVVAAGGTLPQWGFAASPLVTDGLVIVYAGGGPGKGTVAFRAETGEFTWIAGNAKHGYASAHPADFGGVPQALVVSDYGLEAFRPADGVKLWEHVWPVGGGGNRSTQPLVVSDTDVVIGTGVGGDQGVRRLRVTKAGDAWDVQTVWSTRGARPYFNDGVAFGGHFYGFDDGRFCCVDLADGRQLWKDTGYGHGQVVALADQGLLLVQAERGAVALVEANPAEFNELAKVPALTGKTWNHPVLAHGCLYLRNGQEAACYRLPMK
ncbi:PQQ-binding-like beta-propeller repeat protein [Limnoglobus roseus]|uniref:Alcohol dehydrogenase n=1 Tax=Limnoglobus roseus TaxID=2598579 RepID=A0A5C1ADZ9_9BACT|nr:PQQ-binding-like beta-propeller repeat protein [Limnoglobus roseus]QEL16246.1 alcohol dehydrogenase [Limnoglobus roseus]